MRALHRLLSLALTPALLALTPTRHALADGPPPVAASWATTQAAELARQAREHAARGESETAITRYVDALRLDATFAPAYLGLAALYEARGDFREAERTYAVGLDHVPGFADALVARGRLRARLHRRGEAVADLEAAVAIEPAALPVLRELAAAYVSARALPAALAVTRRIAALAEAQRDAPAVAEARLRAKALALLVGEADPVTAGRVGRGPVRNALAAVVRRR